MNKKFFYYVFLFAFLFSSCTAHATDATSDDSDSICVIKYDVKKETHFDYSYRKLPYLHIINSTNKLTFEDNEVMCSVNNLINKYGLSTTKTTSQNLFRDDYIPSIVVSIKKYNKESKVMASNCMIVADPEEQKLHIVKVLSNNKFKETPIIEGTDAVELVNSIKKHFPIADKDNEKDSKDIVSVDNDSQPYSELKMNTTAVYLLDPNEDKKEKIHTFSIIEKSNKVGKVQDLAELIFDNKSYKHGNVVTNSTFLPDIAFLINKDNSKCDVLVSFYCNELIIYEGNNEKRLDFTPIKDKLVEWAISYFPNDEFLKKYRK